MGLFENDSEMCAWPLTQIVARRILWLWLISFQLQPSAERPFARCHPSFINQFQINFSQIYFNAFTIFWQWNFLIRTIPSVMTVVKKFQLVNR